MPSVSHMEALYFGVASVNSMGIVGDVGLAGQDLGGHLTGGHAEVIVADGEGRDAAALADALFAGRWRARPRERERCAMASVLEAAVLSVGT